MVSGGLTVTALAGCGAGNGGTEQSAQTEVSESSQTAAEDNKVTTFALPDGPEESEIYVEPIADLPDDFIRGMDASAVLSLENSGVTYYNYEGKEQDVFETLAQSGVNYIRLRVWNDPYDADGNGYGGGNNDVATAVTLGKRATAYGMKVCVDFHYSDFWADPKRQHAPKAWEGMSASEKSEALYDFTKESLTELLDAGVDVGMVQVGNEINNGMAGEEDVDTVMDLIASGSRAVREIADEYGKDIKVAVHYTNIDDSEEVDTMAANLQNAGVDYDLFGLSYYPYWDGTMENMQAVAENIENTYGKDVYIAETSYCYTTEGGEVTLPDTVEVVYNDRSANTQEDVTWDAEQLAAIDTSEAGSYEVAGTLADGTAVTAQVEVEMVNYVLNPSFEDEDTSMWKVSYEGENNPTDFQNKTDDAYSGDIAFHFWSGDSDMDFSIEQEFTDLEPGTYQLSAYAQGGDMSADTSMELYAVADGTEWTDPFMMTTYADWQNPTVTGVKVMDGTLTIGVRFKCNVKSWGTVDDVTLNRISD